MRKFNIGNILDMLKRESRLIIITTLLVMLISASITLFFISPEYESFTKVYIGKERFNNVSTEYTSEEVNMYQRLIKTYGELVNTKDLMAKAIRNAGQDITVDEGISKVQAIPVTDTQILQLKYVSTSREESYNMIYAITEEFMKTSKKVYPDGDVHIIQQPTIPEEAIGPNSKMNIAIGAILGMMVGVGIVFMKSYMNNSFTDKREMEEELEIPCLGIIPEI